MNVYQKYLDALERLHQKGDPEANRLWPLCPLNSQDLQERIFKRMAGKKDTEVVPNSRPYIIIEGLKRLIKRKEIPSKFSFLDICCGDGLIVGHVAQEFPKAEIYAIDGYPFDSHKGIAENGVRFSHGYLQDMVLMDCPKKFDVAMTLNTMRDWGAAKLHPNDQALPQQLMNWMKNNSKKFIVSSMVRQLNFFVINGFEAEIIGRGEDNAVTAIMEARK